LPAKASLSIVKRDRAGRLTVSSGRKQYRRWAVWLGLFALVLNALVPVHLAFDIAEALGTAPQHGAQAEAHSAEWRLLARLMGHRKGDGKSCGHGKDHKAACPVYGALGTLTGFALTAPIALPITLPIAIATALPVPERALRAAPAAAYRSRAPPVA
jgi:ABC-type phosphate transport system permease subunit